jgi:hypothetical protein
MKIEFSYSYNANPYLKDGYNHAFNRSFLDLIEQFQRDFYERSGRFKANYLHVNYQGRYIMRKYFESAGADVENEVYGMDYVDDDYMRNYDLNAEMDKAGNKTLVYAISTGFDLDEPLFITIEPHLPDNILLLKYIPDSDDDEEAEALPVEGELLSSFLG